MYSYRAKLVRCVDGDTVDFEVDLGFNLFAKIRTRLIGVNTPERGKPLFSEATAILEDLINLNADNEGYIIINTHKTGKYGRWLVDIDNVNSTMADRWPYHP